MNRVVILVLLIICVFCRTKLPEQEYLIENQNTNLIDVMVLSNKTLILSGTKINIKDFDNILTKELGKVTDISSCIIHLKVSKKVSVKELSEIRESLKKKGVKQIKYEPFTEEEEILYQV